MNNCPRCKGLGFIDDEGLIPCDVCGGTGKTPEPDSDPTVSRKDEGERM